jgi:hypothetical protein
VASIVYNLSDNVTYLCDCLGNHVSEKRDHPVPSPAARELVRGAVDYHVHVAPDVVDRRIDDLALARRCLETGLAGFGLKSHYTSTAERARVVAAAVPGVTVLGTITLNAAVGGLNPLAVEVAAREGARIVWLPTVSAVNEQHEVTEARASGNVPVWVRLERSLREAGVRADPVRVVDDHGRLTDAAERVLDVVARHGLVLCTGHLARDEIFVVVAAASERGIGDVVVTHPEFPSQSLEPSEQVELADMGAVMERVFTTAYTGKTTWERVFEATRAVGVERTVWATDLGQLANPPVEDGLALMAEAFLEAGFTEDDVRTMAVTNTRRIAGLEHAVGTIEKSRP